jgi:hypothetical protein
MTTHGFVNAGDLLKAAEAARGLGGEVAFWHLYRRWGNYAFAVLEAALQLGVLKWTRREDGRTKVVYTLGRRGVALLDMTGDFRPVEAYVYRGRLRLQTPLGTFEAELDPGHLLSIAYKLAEALGEDPRKLAPKVKHAAERAARGARGLEKWLLTSHLQPPEAERPAGQRATTAAGRPRATVQQAESTGGTQSRGVSHAEGRHS